MFRIRIRIRYRGDVFNLKLADRPQWTGGVTGRFRGLEDGCSATAEFLHSDSRNSFRCLRHHSMPEIFRSAGRLLSRGAFEIFEITHTHVS